MYPIHSISAYQHAEAFRKTTADSGPWIEPDLGKTIHFDNPACQASYCRETTTMNLYILNFHKDLQMFIS